jgi:DNA sulfur modification protein DndD
MLLETLILHNFGLYSGRQVIELSPVGENKPIILFGGLNGAGKTTILDALQLALYGKFAKTSARQGKAYEEYLLESIHANAPASEGASVELTFSHRSAGITHQFTIYRGWSVVRKRIKEVTSVIRDGHKDEALTMNWNQYIDGILPSKIAQLFFFDGEKITELAELGSTRAFLSSSIQSLLGLDIISQLDVDLDTVIKREKASVKGDVGKNEIRIAEQEVQALKEEHDRLGQKCGGIQNELGRANEKTRKLDSEFESSGGNVYLKQKELELRQSEKRKALLVLDDSMRKDVEGELPLALVGEKLKQLIAQGDLEVKKRQINTSIDILDERDKAALIFLNELPATIEVTKGLESFLANDLKERREQQDEINSYLNFDESSLDNLRVIYGGLDKQRANAKTLVLQRDEFVNEIASIDRALEGISDESQLGSLVKDLEKSKREVIRLQSDFDIASEQKDNALKSLEGKEVQLISIIETAIGHELDNERAHRSVMWGSKVKSILKTYSKELVKIQAKRLENLVYECYVQLLRKENLIKAVSIDPETFDLKLIKENRETLPFDRLSAGERQLLAVAMHWGLARASGRPIPCIIDTPLGRLDSKHRKNLVENYFPHASHQVLLLSTDEEIDEKRRQALSPHIGRLYHLVYDDSEQKTTVNKGYFDLELV